MEAMERGDASAAARVFSADAKLLVSAVDGALVGRAAIEKFWQGAFAGGVKGLRLTTTDLEGAGPLRVETGAYSAVGADGAELGRGNYLFVWRKEAGEWKIFRDMGNSSPPPANTHAAPSAGSAPLADRVGFPAGYQKQFKLLGDSGMDKGGRITTTYGNELAASITSAPQLPYPNGTVILMEFANSLKDGEGELLRDSSGEPLKGEVVRVDVMRRGSGFGQAYGASRAGDWEFASYRPDGSSTPANSADCAACHRNAGAAKDFVFRLRVPAGTR